jgi:hypothetical protein
VKIWGWGGVEALLMIKETERLFRSLRLISDVINRREKEEEKRVTEN